jgi:hypothetical protein
MGYFSLCTCLIAHAPAEFSEGKAVSQRIPVKRVVVVIAGMLAVGASNLCGCAVALADNNHEREACALMDDYGNIVALGEEPAWYALSVLSTEMPRGQAEQVLTAAVNDYCPKHAADLPPGWRQPPP